MDTFIREGDPDGPSLYIVTACCVMDDVFPTAAIAVYEQMLTDEVDPDGMTFHLASRAHVLLVTTAAWVAMVM